LTYPKTASLSSTTLTSAISPISWSWTSPTTSSRYLLEVYDGSASSLPPALINLQTFFRGVGNCTKLKTISISLSLARLVCAVLCCAVCNVDVDVECITLCLTRTSCLQQSTRETTSRYRVLLLAIPFTSTLFPFLGKCSPDLDFTEVGWIDKSIRKLDFAHNQIVELPGELCFCTPSLELKLDGNPTKVCCDQL
jgi:hypothetical protein